MFHDKCLGIFLNNAMNGVVIETEAFAESPLGVAVDCLAVFLVHGCSFQTYDTHEQGNVHMKSNFLLRFTVNCYLSSRHTMTCLTRILRKCE